MAKRRSTAVDWEAVEREFRTGHYSNRELAERHGCSESGIRGRAKKYRWKKDLTDRVREAARIKNTSAIALESKPERTEAQIRAEEAAQKQSDEEVIEAAATRAAAIVSFHRADIARTRALIEKTSSELDRLLVYMAGLKAKGASKFAKSAGLLLRSISQSQARVIPLERKAFGLDDPLADAEDIHITIRSRRERPDVSAELASDGAAESQGGSEDGGVE